MQAGGGGGTQMPVEHVSPPLQLPQLKIPPHPSPHCPHPLPKLWQVAGVHEGGGGGEGFAGASTHMPLTHASLLPHSPQLRLPPQPSLA